MSSDTMRFVRTSTVRWPHGLPLTDGERTIQTHWWHEDAAQSGLTVVGEPRVELIENLDRQVALDDSGAKPPMLVVTTGTVLGTSTTAA